MRRIVIVEDDEAIRESMTIMLENKGYLVTALPNGNTMLNNGYTPPDIFIIDTQLSGISGLDICRHLKGSAATRHIPVIMMSANPDIHTLGKNALADDTLEKPFKMQELRNMVATHLDK